MLFQHSDWDLTHQALFLYIYFAQPSYNRERPAMEILIPWCRELTFLAENFL